MSVSDRPVKNDLDQVAVMVVNKYPSSFKDVLDGVITGSGHSSLTAQLSSRVENIRRSCSVSGIRRKRLNPDNK